MASERPETGEEALIAHVRHADLTTFMKDARTFLAGGRILLRGGRDDLRVGQRGTCILELPILEERLEARVRVERRLPDGVVFEIMGWSEDHRDRFWRFVALSWSFLKAVDHPESRGRPPRGILSIAPSSVVDLSGPPVDIAGTPRAPRRRPAVVRSMGPGLLRLISETPSIEDITPQALASLPVSDRPARPAPPPPAAPFIPLPRAGVLPPRPTPAPDAPPGEMPSEPASGEPAPSWERTDPAATVGFYSMRSPEPNLPPAAPAPLAEEDVDGGGFYSQVRPSHSRRPTPSFEEAYGATIVDDPWPLSPDPAPFEDPEDPWDLPQAAPPSPRAPDAWGTSLDGWSPTLAPGETGWTPEDHAPLTFPAEGDAPPTDPAPHAPEGQAWQRADALFEAPPPPPPASEATAPRASEAPGPEEEIFNYHADLEEGRAARARPSPPPRPLEPPPRHAPPPQPLATLDLREEPLVLVLTELLRGQASTRLRIGGPRVNREIHLEKGVVVGLEERPRPDARLLLTAAAAIGLDPDALHLREGRTLPHDHPEADLVNAGLLSLKDGRRLLSRRLSIQLARAIEEGWSGTATLIESRPRAQTGLPLVPSPAVPLARMLWDGLRARAYTFAAGALEDLQRTLMGTRLRWTPDARSFPLSEALSRDGEIALFLMIKEHREGEGFTVELGGREDTISLWCLLRLGLLELPTPEA